VNKPVFDLHVDQHFSMNTQQEAMMNSSNPTAQGRWQAVMQKVFPQRTKFTLSNVHVTGMFENAGYQGVETAYAPEQGVDLSAMCQGKAGEIGWRHAPALEWQLDKLTALEELMPTEPWSTIFVYAEVEVDTPHIAEFSFASSAMASAWSNGQLVRAPLIPWTANLADDRVLILLQPGINSLLLKLNFGEEPWTLEWHCEGLGAPQQVQQLMDDLIAQSPDDLTRLMARFSVVEIYALQGKDETTLQALEALRGDPIATQWDHYWVDVLLYHWQNSGSFLPLHDVQMAYTPNTDVEPHPTFWPQSPAPANQLLVLDVSQASPQEEFALSVLQGLVNREIPSLYLLHTRYSRQDREWLEELHLEGYTSREIDVTAVKNRFEDKVKGAVLYDGSIMDEIGEFHSDRLNQTNLIMMICALEDAVPLTPQMNAELGLPVLFDARGKWASQYEMMRWAYVELFPRMDQRILATQYPGIFLLTDYLVAFKVFTFWFPEHRVLPEENLLRGILASTPPNTPIIGWWFDWMPNPKDPKKRHADAVMEEQGLMCGSIFGKILTPSHEATNLTVHSGVAVGNYRHKEPDMPAFDPQKIYYTHIISDGDNLGEALMLQTRDLQWDKPERGSVPMGWSFAPAAARIAPPVLNYYLRTASANDLLVGGLGVGYTEPILYLRAFPEQREELYAEYTRMTDEALRWLDTSCLWLIDGRDEEEDRYALSSSGQLQGIFTGYGGAPEMACARKTHNDVIAFQSAVRLLEGADRETKLSAMVAEIRETAGKGGPPFIEAWVLNWDWTMEMLLEVQRRLGPDFVCVRPDVLVKLRQQWEN
jgi:hypothetical protein